jgi:pimeloyl-ACP methyl ester carboxylesterase
VVEALEARGHTVAAPTLPLHDPATSYEERIQPALAAVKGRLVAVGHSGGSSYAPLVAIRRPGSTLVHLCPALGGFPQPDGAPAAAFRAGAPFPPRRADGSMVWEREDGGVAAMYRRLRPDLARATARRLVPATPAKGDYPLDSHPDVPTVLIYARHDEFFEPDWERFMARELLGVEPIELPTGHFPMLEDPHGLAKVLDSVARQ